MHIYLYNYYSTKCHGENPWIECAKRGSEFCTRQSSDGPNPRFTHNIHVLLDSTIYRRVGYIAVNDMASPLSSFAFCDVLYTCTYVRC